MKKNIVVPLLVLLAVGGLLAGKGVSVLRESGNKVDALVNANIDLSRLSDGVYTGSCDSGLVNAEVRVEVKGRKIAGIELVKHDHLKGKPGPARAALSACACRSLGRGKTVVASRVLLLVLCRVFC